MIADGVSRTRLRGHADRKLWFYMLGCSLMLHATVVLIATAKWRLSAGKPRFAPVYSVELVSLPAPDGKKISALRHGSKATAPARQQAIPIRRFRAKQEPLTLRKKKRVGVPEKETEEVRVSEKVLANLERRPLPPPILEEGRDEPSRVGPSKKKVSLVNIGGMKGEELSQALGLYRALVYERIESNWVFPERLIPDNAKLEAIVVVRARRDGTLLDIQFEKKSGDSYFDDSVLKAILKSKPFPAFPDIYSPKEEEIVIRFSPANGKS